MYEVLGSVSSRRRTRSIEKWGKLDYYVTMEKDQDAIVIAVITLLIYLITVFPVTRAFANSLFMFFVFVAGAGIIYWPFSRSILKNDILRRMYFLAIFTSLLFWIGITGWFFSPFFYFLYILAVMLAFMYSSFTTLLFVLVMLGLFLPNVGSIDLTVDIITMVSLVSVVPLTHFLQKEYLQLKQTQKKVLILEEKSKDLKNKVDEVLMNKVTKFAVDIRQPVNDIRQVAMVAIKSKSQKKLEDAIHKIIVLGKESLDQVDQFEQIVTGKKLLKNKKSTKKKKAKK